MRALKVQIPQQVEPGIVSDLKPWDIYSAKERKTFLLVLFLVGTSNYVDRNVIGVLLEQIKDEFQASDTMLGVLTGLSFALLYATLGVPVARWADHGDRKQVITLSLIIWSVMTVVCGFANTFWQLAAARFGVGAGEAGAVPPAQSLLADYFPPTQRARAIGIFVASSAAGYALGLIVGGFIAQNYGWRAAFITFGLTGFALAPLTHFLLREPRRCIRFAVAREGEESTWSAVRILFQKPAYRNIVAAMIVYYLMAYGALVFIVSLMIRVHGVSVATAGAIFGSIFAVGAMIGSVGGGALADRLAAADARALTRIAGWGMIIASPFYEFALWSPTIAVMIPLLFVGAVLLNAAVPPAFSALHVVCGSRRRALAIALTYFLANLIGLGLGPTLAGALSDEFATTYGSGEGLRLSLMVLMSLLVLAGWLMLRAGRSLELDAED